MPPVQKEMPVLNFEGAPVFFQSQIAKILLGIK